MDGLVDADVVIAEVAVVCVTVETESAVPSAAPSGFPITGVVSAAEGLGGESSAAAASGVVVTADRMAESMT